jgi:type I restriction enzyme S subunit
VSLVTSGSRGWAEHYTDQGAAFLRIGNLSREGIDLDLREIQCVNPPRDAEGLRTRVKQGDVLISVTAYIGSVGVVPRDLGEAYVNQHIALTRPLPELVEPRWLAYCLLSHVGKYQFGLDLYCGTKDGLGLDEVRNLGIILPPAEEQRLLVRWLDRETAKIGNLIAKKLRLIELLHEKRAALISHAVTKGLNHHAPMKSSGIEWLGNVPRHWILTSLRYFATFRTGSTPDRGTKDFWNGGIPWVKTGEINYSTIMTTEETISKEGMASCSVAMAPAGTLLMALYGQGATRGRVALLGIPATYNQACAAIQVDGRISCGFLHAFLEFSYAFIRDTGNETTQMNLNLELFDASVWLFLPFANR